MWFSVFVVLAIIFRIGLFLYFIFYGQFIDNDAHLYIKLAENLVVHGEFSESLTPPFQPEIFRTPGYPVFLAILMKLGMEHPNWVVFWQELIYGLSIFLFYRFGRPVFNQRCLRLGLIFLLLDPGGLVAPKLIMTELLFLPFFLGAMLAILYYLQNRGRHFLIVAGVIFGLAILIRPAAQYIPVIASIVILLFSFKKPRQWLHPGILLLSFTIIIAPWLIRNYHYFGEVFMSGQQSNILINYHAPIVMADALNIPRSQAKVTVDELVKQSRQQKQVTLGRALTLTEGFHLEQELALKVLGQYPRTYAKQWILGMLKTMNGPFITQLYDSLGIKPDRLRFADALEQGFFPGLIYYFKNVDLFFLINLLLTIAMSGFALLGSIAIIKSKDPFLWIMMLANCYFLFIPGPEGYPRFRFPIGLFWFFQASIGYYWLMAFWQKIPYSPCLYSKQYIESRSD